MEIEAELVAAFPALESEFESWDQSIRATPDPMEVEGEPDLLRVVPAYMLWCIRNTQEDDDYLVSDHTINALAEYGRCTDQKNRYLNFRYRCNAQQMSAVSHFLAWCKRNLPFANKVQIDRSLKHWRAS